MPDVSTELAELQAKVAQLQSQLAQARQAAAFNPSQSENDARLEWLRDEHHRAMQRFATQIINMGHDDMILEADRSMEKHRKFHVAAMREADERLAVAQGAIEEHRKFHAEACKDIYRREQTYSGVRHDISLLHRYTELGFMVYDSGLVF